MKNNQIPEDEKIRIENSATGYTGIFNDENQRNISWLSEKIVQYSKNKSNILELGLGDGTTTKIFAKYFTKVITLDGSSNLINIFQQNNKITNLELIETFFEDFETEEKFDNIVMSNILEHVYDPDYIIEKYKKFLKKDGMLFLSVPSATSLNRRIGNLAGMLPNIYALQEQDHVLGHRRYFCKETFLKLLANHQLNIEKVEGVNLKIITTTQMQQLNFSEDIYNALLTIGQAYPELCTIVFVVASLKN